MGWTDERCGFDCAHRDEIPRNTAQVTIHRNKMRSLTRKWKRPQARTDLQSTRFRWEGNDEDEPWKDANYFEMDDVLRRRDAGDATAGEVDVRRRWRLPGVARALPKCRGGRWCVSVRDRVTVWEMLWGGTGQHLQGGGVDPESLSGLGLESLVICWAYKGLAGPSCYITGPGL
jgi:hypothetical protein